MKRIRVGILFGGKSAEHEVSILSARNVANALDAQKYEAVLIGITHEGHWLPPNTSAPLLRETTTTSLINTQTLPLSFSAESNALTANGTTEKIDVVFPVLHGPYGEDGTVQGLLKTMGVPFVGAGVLGSAVGMDKDVMKRLLRDAGIPIGKFLVATHGAPVSFAVARKKLGLPLFIKPANLGSSVGVSKARTKKEYDAAVAHALSFDTKILIEKFINGREIEVAVLGNEKPVASVAGELIIASDFYSYEAKYTDPEAMVPQIPARLTAATAKKVRELAVKTFTALCCEGLGRVDFFVTKQNKIYVNEINTIPGFTNISMYPKLWEASGMSQTKLIDTLIQLALERHVREQKLQIKR